MFITVKNPEKNINPNTLDISMHSGIPKRFYAIKNKQFSDWEIPPWELYIFENILLGTGSFSKVYLAKWRETLVVAKVINRNICEARKSLVMREFEIMTKLHHPNIVQFLGYIDYPFIIVMEYIPKGDLQKNIPKLKKSEKLLITNDILRALAYIHNRLPNSLIHRDIKPTNILLTKSKTAKITDFGLSKFYNLQKINSCENLLLLEDREINELTSDVGTERYMAPEANNSNNYTNKIDIYSCGILLYEMFENKRYLPMRKMSWWWTPTKFKTIINKFMICDDPNQRLPATDIIRLINM